TELRQFVATQTRISIHVPREGDDHRSLAFLLRRLRFLSTSPARGTTNREGRLSMENEFLSTSPARGTTILRRISGRRRNISIHVPREGDDRLDLRHDLDRAISIHVPREGDDWACPMRT